MSASGAGLQLGADGRLRHLLTLEGLPAATIRSILDAAEPFASIGEREVKKVPLMRGKAVFNLFFENSTRTRTTFEIAAKRLSADVINLNIGASSTSKGETLLDTVDNLVAMNADMFVVRHAQSGAAHLIASHLEASGQPHVHVVNAGDGRHAHPTQGLLDLYTIRHYKHDFANLSVAIVGDVLHSRVARSLIHGLTTLGTPDVRVIGPRTLIPARVEALGVRVFHDMHAGLADCDVVVMLRLAERADEGRAAAVVGRVLHELRAHRGEARAREAGRDRHASRPDEPRRRDRLAGRRRGAQRDPAAGHLRHRGADGGHEHDRGRVTAMRIEIRHGRVVDPASGHDAVASLWIADGAIAAIGAPPAGFAADRTIEASGCLVLPGLVDLDARLREPGLEYKATLDSELKAAVAGGVTSLACPPDTDPPLDEPGLVEMLRDRARASRRAHVYPVGALTLALEGTTLAGMGELAHAGCVAFSQGDVPIADTQVLLRAMQYAATFGHRVWLRPQDARLVRGGVAHEGEIATRLGLPAIPACAETIALATHLALARETGVRLHVQRLSTAEGVAMIRAAKAGRAPRHLRGRARTTCTSPTSTSAGSTARRASTRRCAARATAPRCGRDWPTARSTWCRPGTPRSTTTRSSCRSPRRRRARPASSCCCRWSSSGRRRTACRSPPPSRARRPRRRRCSASRLDNSARARPRTSSWSNLRPTGASNAACW